MTVQIIPTILTHSIKEFTPRFEKLLPLTRQLQIDFMDGIFVPEKSIALDEVPDLQHYKEEHSFEAHLMVAHPEKWISQLKAKGFSKVIFHYESCDSDEEREKIIERIHAAEMKAMLALNPETRVEKILPLLKNVDGVLLLGVTPGREGQKLDPRTAEKARELRRLTEEKNIHDFVVQVDGGVTTENIGELAAAGVDACNSGSFVSKSTNPKEAIAALEVAAQEKK